MNTETDLRSMRAAFEVNLSFIPDHIKRMSYRDYLNASPKTLENYDPNVRRQSSKLNIPVLGSNKQSGSMAAPMATPAHKSKRTMLQTPMVSRAFSMLDDDTKLLGLATMTLLSKELFLSVVPTYQRLISLMVFVVC